MHVIGSLHKHAIFPRRVERLSHLLADALPPGSSVIDVGCGDGQISQRIAELRPGLHMEGMDVLVRPQTAIPVREYDGTHFPYPDRAVDMVMLVDVLHHTQHPEKILAEAARVARVAVVVKDHTVVGPFARLTLRAMDWVGNAHHGVALPYNYWTKEEWERTFEDLGLEVSRWNAQLDLYAVPLRPVFERSLHFIGVLKIKEESREITAEDHKHDLDVS